MNAKATPAPNKEIVEGAGAHGGVLTVTYYFDNKYKPVPKEEAARAIVHEYDEKNRSIFRDYITYGEDDTDYESQMVLPPPQKPRQDSRPFRPRQGDQRPPRAASSGDEARPAQPRRPRKPRPAAQDSRPPKPRPDEENVQAADGAPKPRSNNNYRRRSRKPGPKPAGGQNAQALPREGAPARTGDSQTPPNTRKAPRRNPDAQTPTAPVQ